jgi:acetyl esterase/lipase
MPDPLTGSRPPDLTLRLAEPRLGPHHLFWLESTPTDEGRWVLCRERQGTPERLTPPGWGIRSRVYEYGGGAYLPTARGIFFVDDREGALHRLTPDRHPVRIGGHSTERYGDLSGHPDPDLLFCVVERERGGTEPEHLIGSWHARRQEFSPLCRGSDFYLAPRVDSTGTRLAWIEWDHPRLPWQGTRLRIGRIDRTGQLRESRLVAGGKTETVIEPLWGRGGWLYFLSDRSGFSNLYRWHPHQGIQCLSRLKAELGRPSWNLGQSCYGLFGDERIGASFVRNARSELWRIGESGPAIRLPLPMGDLNPLVVRGRRAVAILNRPDRTPALVSWGPGPESALRIVRGGERESPSAGGVSSLRFPGSDGKPVQGFFYRPQGQPPYPCVIRCHGGPTSMATLARDFRIASWRTLGLAVFDINYRGSSGFGRAYREALAGRWGILDADDIERGTRFLIETGLADPTRLYLAGSSAGGFTALRTLLRFPGFQAASLLYPVTDLLVLERTSPKFESHYGHFLVGPPETTRAQTRSRSPVHHVEDLPRISYLIFQGSADPVVPAPNTRRFADRLKRHGAPVRYVEFKDEGHGFGRPDSLKRVLLEESRLFDPAHGPRQSDD